MSRVFVQCLDWLIIIGNSSYTLTLVTKIISFYQQKMCVNLYCEIPDAGYCSSNDEPAADGTECDTGKVINHPVKASISAIPTVEYDCCLFLRHGISVFNYSARIGFQESHAPKNTNITNTNKKERAASKMRDPGREVEQLPAKLANANSIQTFFIFIIA